MLASISLSSLTSHTAKEDRSLKCKDATSGGTLNFRLPRFHAPAVERSSGPPTRLEVAHLWNAEINSRRPTDQKTPSSHAKLE
jgi:hypothetical protein